MSREPVPGYMCKTDFDHELGGASDGVRVYPSEKTARRHLPCIHQCGLVEVSVSFARVVQEEDWSSPSKRGAQGTDAGTAETENTGSVHDGPVPKG